MSVAEKNVRKLAPIIIALILVCGNSLAGDQMTWWYADPVFVPVPSGNRSTATGDVVGDSREDLLVGTNGQILLFENRGDLGSLELVETFDTGPFATVAVGEFRDGGGLEVVAVFEAFGGDSLVVWQDLGDGFTQMQGLKEPCANLSRVAYGDINSDNYTDLVAAGRGDSVFVYLGGSDGIERAEAYGVKVQAGCQGWNGVPCVQFADVDGDAILDIVVVAENGAHCPPLVRGAGFLSGAGDGTFGSIQWVVQETYAEGFPFLWAEVADVNDDMVPDFTVAAECVRVFLGPVGPGTELPPFESGIGLDTYRFADADGDGFLDLIGGNGGWYFTASGDGLGSFELNGYVNAGIEAFRPIDLDGQGGPDLAGCDADGYLTLLQSTTHLDPSSVPEATAKSDLQIVNPSRGELRLVLQSETGGPVKFLFTDAAGRAIAVRNTEVPSGRSEVAVEERLGGSGIRFVKVSLPNGRTLGRKFLWLGD